MASPEYTTMVECTVELIEDISNNLPSITNTLFANHFISPSIRDEVLHPMYGLPKAKAGKLVSVMTSRVQIQPEAFEKFVRLLDPSYFVVSLDALKKKYKKNSGKELNVPEAPLTKQNGYPDQMQSTISVTQNPRFGNTHEHSSEHQHSQPTVYHTALDELEPVKPVSKTGLNWTPDLDDLLWFKQNEKSVRVIARVASLWEQLALALRVEAYIIRTIRKDHASSCEDACTHLFQRWLEGEGREVKTWATIVEALEEIQEEESASLIKSVLE